MPTFSERNVLSLTCYFSRQHEVKSAIEDCLETFAQCKHAPPELFHDASQINFEIEPGGLVTNDYALWEPLNGIGTTAFMCRLQDGWDSLAHCVSKSLGCKCVRIFASKDLRDSSANMFFVIENGKMSRCVYVLKDGGWKFYQEGSPLSFEDTSKYSLQKKERLTFDMVISYLRALGWLVDQTDFWKSNGPGFLFREIGEWRNGLYVIP